MKIKRILILAFYFFTLAGIAFAEPAATKPSSLIADINDFFSKFDLATHGSLKNETAYRIHKPTELTKVRNQLMLTETGKLSDYAKFKITGRFYYDSVYDFTDNFPGNVRRDQAREAEFRDTYIDYSKGPFDIRLGKQQIVWGEAVGLFFADVVNARDLREFVLPDFDMIRIPQWGADLEYGKDNFHLEGIWLPDLQFDKRGVTNSEFAFPYPVPENTSFTAQDPRRPKSNFGNSETGLRMSYLTHGWDISTFYLYTWEKSPVMFRSIDSGVFNFHPGYRRLNIFGSTFAKEINDVVLKGEFVFNRKGNFSIIDSTNPDGVTRKDFIDYLLGLDYTFWKKIDVNLQFMQRVIFNFDDRIVNEDRVHNAVSLRLSKGFLNDSLETEFLVIAGLMRKDIMYRPKVTYSFKNNWKLRLGLDIFEGEPSGVFGMFEKKSRTYCELTYSF